VKRDSSGSLAENLPVNRALFKGIAGSQAGGTANQVTFGTDPRTGKQLIHRRARGDRVASGALVIEDDIDELLQTARVQEAAFATVLADLRLHPEISCWNIHEGSVVMERMHYPNLLDAWSNEAIRDEIAKTLVDKLTAIAELGLCLLDMKNENVVVTEKGEVYFIDVDVRHVLFVNRFFELQYACSSYNDAPQLVTFYYNLMLLQLLQTCRKDESFVESLQGKLRRDAAFLQVASSFSKSRCPEFLERMWNYFNPDTTLSEAWKTYKKRAKTDGLLNASKILPRFFDKSHKLPIKPAKEAAELAEQLDKYYKVYEVNQTPCPDTVSQRLTTKSHPEHIFRTRSDVGPPSR
jgi:hypothetical protein